MAAQLPAQEVADLARRAQKGDQEAFGELFHRLHAPVLNYIYRMVGDRGDAEDITQDAFLRAHRNILQLGPPFDFKSWVYRIAGNLALTFLKRERIWVHPEDFDRVVPAEASERPAEKAAQRKELRLAVWRTLGELPAEQRQALILREFNQLSYEEMSFALERSYDNVRQLVHRARLRFVEAHVGGMMLREGPLQCSALGDLVSAYRDQELKADERKAVREHIAACVDCQATEKRLRRAGALLALIPPLIPSEAWAAQVMRGIHRQSPSGLSPSASGSHAALSPPLPSPPVAPVPSPGGPLSQEAAPPPPPTPPAPGRPPAPTAPPSPTRPPQPARPPSPSLAARAATRSPVGSLILFGVVAVGLLLSLGLLSALSWRQILSRFAASNGGPAGATAKGVFADRPLSLQGAGGGRTRLQETQIPPAAVVGTSSGTPSATFEPTASAEPTSTSTPTPTPPSASATPTSTPSPIPSSTQPMPTPTSTASAVPTATATLAPPAAPTKLVISARVCDGTSYTVTLSWIDNANNEDGYRVYRDGKPIAVLKADATSYTDVPPGYGPSTYEVEAFNAAGVSKRAKVLEGGCLF